MSNNEWLAVVELFIDLTLRLALLAVGVAFLWRGCA